MALYHYYLMPSIEEVDHAMDQIRNTGDTISTEGISFSKMKETLINFFKKIGEMIKNFFKRLVDGIQGMVSKIVGFFGKKSQAVRRTLDQLDENDKLKLYRDAVTHITTRTLVLFNDDGNLIDIDENIQLFDNITKLLLDKKISSNNEI